MEKVIPILGLGDVLDLGCGVGRLTREIAPLILPANIYGVDSSRNMLNLATVWAAQHPNVGLYHNDGINLPVELPDFRSAFSIGMFEQVPDEIMRGYLQQISDRLPHGGIFLYQFAYQGAGPSSAFTRDYDDVRRWQSIPIERLGWDEQNKWCWVKAVKR